MKKVYSILLLVLFVALPKFSHAYGVVDSHITHLSSTLTMYTLEMEFGFGNADMWMPIASKQSVNASGNQTASLILSTSTIQGSKYFVPMGEKGLFTLLVLEQHEVGKSQGKVTVDNLTVSLQRETDDEPFKRTFGKDELKDFVVE